MNQPVSWNERAILFPLLSWASDSFCLRYPPSGLSLLRVFMKCCHVQTEEELITLQENIAWCNITLQQTKIAMEAWLISRTSIGIYPSTIRLRSLRSSMAQSVGPWEQAMQIYDYRMAKLRIFIFHVLVFSFASTIRMCSCLAKRSYSQNGHCLETLLISNG